MSGETVFIMGRVVSRLGWRGASQATTLLFLVTSLQAGDPPSLPGGLGGLPSSTAQIEEAEQSLLDEVSGFLEMRGGIRFGNAEGYSDESLAEMRLQLKTEQELGAALLELSFDLLADASTSEHSFDWESGQSWFDVRALNLSFSPTQAMDIKIGRQVATWGVGDLVFINDLFSKDWNSFFLGRDLEYLKAPQDSVRVSLFNDLADIDVIYSPRFQADRFIDGDRIAYWDAMNSSLTRRSSPIAVASPGDAFEADELHLRASRMIDRYELSAYGYFGYWKSPAGFDPSNGLSTFPGLQVFGASARGPLGKGLLSAEFGSYESHSDASGADPFVRNSELRFLLGYEQEVGKELTGSLQYYVERTRDFATAASGADRDRDLLTLRLSKRLWQQTLTLNGFVFYSPSQNDNYTRLCASWKASDEWRWDMGANLFGGAENSFFGQFAGNENFYLSLRRFF